MGVVGWALLIMVSWHIALCMHKGVAGGSIKREQDGPAPCELA